MEQRSRSFQKDQPFVSKSPALGQRRASIFSFAQTRSSSFSDLKSFLRSHGAATEDRPGRSSDLPWYLLGKNFDAIFNNESENRDTIDTSTNLIL